MNLGRLCEGVAREGDLVFVRMPMVCIWSNGGFSYIDAPISERHRQEIQTSLSRMRPSIHEAFSTLLPVYKEAMTTFGAGHFALAIQKFRRMLDLCYRLRLLYSRDAPTELATGLLAGLSLEENIGTMPYTSDVALAEAYLKFPKDVQHVRAAQGCCKACFVANSPREP